MKRIEIHPVSALVGAGALALVLTVSGMAQDAGVLGQVEPGTGVTEV